MQVIDLHGARYRDVYGLLEPSCIHSEVPFEIITGKSSTMKNIVSEIVRKFNLQAREKMGNSGTLVIYENKR